MGELHRGDLLTRAHPDLRSFAMAVAAASPHDWQVVTCARSQAEVTAKWAEGRTAPGPHAGETGFPMMGETVTRVHDLTKAPHALRQTPAGLVSCAVDLQFFVGHQLSPGASHEDRAVYLWYGELAEAHGLKWGGRFKGLFDQAHVEVPGWEDWPVGL